MRATPLPGNAASRLDRFRSQQREDRRDARFVLLQPGDRAPLSRRQRSLATVPSLIGCDRALFTRNMPSRLTGGRIARVQADRKHGIQTQVNNLAQLRSGVDTLQGYFPVVFACRSDDHEGLVHLFDTYPSPRINPSRSRASERAGI
jgi:hypothetical protein